VKDIMKADCLVDCFRRTNSLTNNSDIKDANQHDFMICAFFTLRIQDFSFGI
jgi:hypothetical protein